MALEQELHDREDFYPENDIKAFAIMEKP